jgi:endonuclease YncB( thermonuclease family)
VLTGADIRGAWFESDLRPAMIDDTGLARVKYDAATTKWPLDFDARPAVLGEAPDRGSAAPARPKDLVEARVVDVVDGDNLRVEAAPGGHHDLPSPGRTRLIGVNAPDLEDPGGVAAWEFVEDRLEGRRVAIQVGPTARLDDGDRHLVYVWTAGERTFNEQLLDSGHAQFQAGENKQYEYRFQAAELRAKRRGAALWRKCPQGG